MSDVETARRRELADRCPDDNNAPRIRRIAAIGARSIDFNRQAFKTDSRVVYESMLDAAKRGIAIEPDFEISCFALPDRDFLRTQEKFDMACLLYIPGTANGCDIYEPMRHDSLPRDDLRWHHIVTLGHTRENWQQALRRARIKLVAAYYGHENELAATDFTQKAARRAQAYTLLDTEAIPLCNRFLSFCADHDFIKGASQDPANAARKTGKPKPA